MYITYISRKFSDCKPFLHNLFTKTFSNTKYKNVKERSKYKPEMDNRKTKVEDIKFGSLK